MDYTTFRKIWDESGLPEYYQRMEDLQRMGYTFASRDGDMDFCESEALKEWLGDERSIMDVTLPECETILPEIRKRAEILRHNDQVDLTGPHGGPNSKKDVVAG